MISRDDIIGLCGLTEAEVDAVAEHEHLAMEPAAALGAYLLHETAGQERIAAMIRDDIRSAIVHGDRVRARDLVAALHHFLTQHPPDMH